MERYVEPTWKAARRKRILDSSFEMFSERGIDLVSVEEIAKECGVTRVTIYNYFPSKLDLVIGVGAAKWREYFDEMMKKHPRSATDALTAKEHFEFYLDCFIDLYKKRRELLRFNQYFNLYVKSAKATEQQMTPYTEAIGILRKGYGRLFEKAKNDGTLRTDIAEETMFSAVLHIMLAAVTRYASGLVYAPDSGADPGEELLMLKEMLLHKFSICTEV